MGHTLEHIHSISDSKQKLKSGNLIAGCTYWSEVWWPVSLGLRGAKCPLPLPGSGPWMWNLALPATITGFHHCLLRSFLVLYKCRLTKFISMSAILQSTWCFSYRIVSYFMSKYVLIEAAVRNVLHHYAVMMSLKNHRIQLDNVAVV